ncbi:MAG: hypothetical protein ACI4IJ_06715 [Acutalibacteraceae bacterium]
MDKLRYGNMKPNNGRKTYSFITRKDLTPNELKERTLEGMIERRKKREFQAARRKKTAIRLAAAAAVIAVVVVVTPLRGYASTAANNFYNAIHGWMYNSFPVGQRKSNNGCTVEIVEARVANDFLYLTVNESYDKNLVKRDNETKLYELPDISYAGHIKDNNGNKISFDSGNLMYLWGVSNDHPIYYTGYEQRIVDGAHDDWYKETDAFVMNVGYRIYIPELSSVINSNSKKYTCELNVSSKQMNSSIDFNFDIYNIAEQLKGKSYELNRSFEVKGVEFTLDKLNMSTSVTDLIIKVNMTEKIEHDIEYLLDNFWGCVNVKSDEDESLSMELYSGRWYDNGYIYDFDYDVNSDSIMWDKPKYVKSNGQYYIIISYFDLYGDDYAEKISDNDFTVEVEYLGWNLHDDGDINDYIITDYHPIKDISMNPQKTPDGKYTLNAHIPLESKYGSLDILLKEISERDTVKLEDGAYMHNLKVDAEFNFKNWKSFERDGVLENIYLVNSKNQEVMTIALTVDSGGKSSGTIETREIYCTAVDNKEYFELSDNYSELHVAYVMEGNTNNPNAWFNPKYKAEDIDALNEQRFIHFKIS